MWDDLLAHTDSDGVLDNRAKAKRRQREFVRRAEQLVAVATKCTATSDAVEHCRR